MRARAGRSARARAPYRRGTAVLDVCIESALQRFRRADVQRATPAGRSSCRRLGGIVEFFYVQVLGTLAAVLFFALPVLAMLPACSTSLRGFSLSLAGFVVGLLVFLVCVVVSLAHTKRGEGPAAFGIGFHLLAVGAIFSLRGQFASWSWWLGPRCQVPPLRNVRRVDDLSRRAQPIHPCIWPRGVAMLNERGRSFEGQGQRKRLHWRNRDLSCR